MSVMTTLLKKGGLKAIAEEPVKLVCDVMRQPLKMLDNMEERKKMELQYRHECGMKEYEMELGIRKEKEENENKISYRKAMKEIDDMIADKQIERQEKLAIAIGNYQKTMAEASASMAKLIGNMQIDLRERAYNLIAEKTKEYTGIQEITIARAEERFQEIEEKYPNESRIKDVMIRAVEVQMTGVIGAAEKFITTMNDDLVNMMKNIDQLTSQTVIQANGYLSTMTAKNVVNEIRNGDVRMIEEHR